MTDTLLHLMEKLPGGVIAIDGRAAAGKSTLAARLAAETGAGVVHMDDFFLPAELRAPARFANPGGNIHHERFMQEVLPFLRNGEEFMYRIFDCKIMDYNGTRPVASAAWRVVEGAYALHPVLGDYADIKVFADVTPALQRERIEARNGPEAAAQFYEKWIPLEEAYIRAYKINETADMVV